MSEGVELKAMSYAKIVNPAAEAEQEKAEAVEVAEEASGERQDDEGFQEVTNKKAEKAREKPKRKRRVGPRKAKEFKEGSVEQEESQGSKEVTPEKEEDEEKEEIEYVPAPPPKNNPWKKPAAKAATARKQQRSKMWPIRSTRLARKWIIPLKKPWRALAQPRKAILVIY